LNAPDNRQKTLRVCQYICWFWKPK